MRPKLNVRTLLAGGASLALAAVASGFVFFSDETYVAKWQTTPVRLVVKLPNTGSLVDGTTLTESFVAATQAWNAVLGTMQISTQTVAPGNYRPGNGVNEIVMDSTVSGMAFSDGVLAITRSFPDDGDGIGEADIVFNTAYNWNSYRGIVRSGMTDIRRVALHELGHLLGLGHPDTGGQSVPAIMNSVITSLDVLQPDDIAGGQQLYGAPGFVPANNDFANATNIVMGEGTRSFTGSSIAATRESGEPKHDNALVGHSVWWKWTAFVGGDITITTLGSDFDTVLAVYTGAEVSALTLRAVNDDFDPGVIRTSTLKFTAVAGTTYYIAVDGWGDAIGQDGGYSGTITLNLTFAPSAGQPVFATQPASRAVAAGANVTLTADASNTTSYQWQRNGTNLAGATSATLNLTNVQPADAGLYVALATGAVGTVSSEAAIVGVQTTSKVIGTGSEVGPNIVHANGTTYDQVLLTGPAATVTADAGQVLRISFVDLNNDIVQVEFSGAGTLTLTLDNPTGPAVATSYNQPTVSYMKGHGSIVITGADETTNLGVFSVGTATALNQALFKSNVTYDGIADIGYVAIQSANGRFGGLRAANADFFGMKGIIGIYAPGVQFTGGANNIAPLWIFNLEAYEAAIPVLITGSAPDVRITGGDMAQHNGQPVQVDGMTRIQMAAGTTSHSVPLPAQALRTQLIRNGVDVTSQLVPPSGG